jgi:hypothetical protein
VSDYESANEDNGEKEEKKEEGEGEEEVCFRLIELKAM